MSELSERLFSRKRIIQISKIGTTLSLLALVVELVAPSFPFMLRLATCFVFFLFAFHWMFGAAKSLTVTHTRLIDYVYLGIAAIGVFVLEYSNVGNAIRN